MLKNISLIALLAFSWLFSAVNTWQKAAANEIGSRTFGAVVYCPDSNRFILSLGYPGATSPYAEMAYDNNEAKWTNFLPSASLYGIWAESTGNAMGRGASLYSNFNSSRFEFKQISEGGVSYLRPNIIGNNFEGRAYYQYAYNSDDKKIYYYINNLTFTYNTLTRLWENLNPATHPAASEGGTSRLNWGSMCYDPIHKEMVLFGGGCVDMNGGAPGTWIYKPAGNTWTRLHPTVEPPSRADAPMVYDETNQVIVLFGGDHLDHLFSDTWIYDCATREWTKKNPPLSPSPRAGHALMYLPKSKSIVLLGGFGYTSSKDYSGTQYAQKMPVEMWKYDVVSDAWSVIKTFSISPTTPYLNVTIDYCMTPMVAVDTGDCILAMGNETEDIYAYAPKTYRLTCDPSIIDSAATRSLGVVQGTTGRRVGPFVPEYFTEGVDAADTSANESLLRNLPIDTWVRVTQPKLPGLYHLWGTTVFDPVRDRFYKWAGGHWGDCGTTVPDYSVSENRWSIGFDSEWILDFTYYGGAGGGSTHYSFNERPFVTGHTYRNMNYDINSQKMLFVKLQYTYLYNPDTKDWDSTRVVNPPEMAGAHAYRTCLIPTDRGAFAWVSTGEYSNTFNFFLFIADSMKWRKLPVVGPTIPIYWCDLAGGVYDSKRDRMILQSRYSQDTSSYNKVWTYDFKTGNFTQLIPTGDIPPKIVYPAYNDTFYVREAVYEPSLDIMFVQNNYAYHCDENRWEKLTLANASGEKSVNGYNSGYMYDPKRALIWDCEQNGETYVLRLNGSSPIASEKRTPSELKKAKRLSVFPNPFNPVTKLSFVLTNEMNTKASLTIYNVAGSMVKGWRLSGLQGGRQDVAWNGRNEQGEQQPSGLYIAKLTVSGKTIQTKLVLTK